MTESQALASTRTSRVIDAAPDVLYRAFLDPAALLDWLPPGGMTGKMHAFEAGPGGGYDMSLFYPPADRDHVGKTADWEDRVKVRFLTLDPPHRIIESVDFVTDDPALQGEMMQTITFEEAPGGTRVTLLFEHLPAGISPEDNDKGARQSLEQLARRFG